MLKFVPTTLPWNMGSAREASDFREKIVGCCGQDVHALLPHSMRFLMASVVSESHAHETIGKVASFLGDEELPKWLRRREQAIRLGLSNDVEMSRLLDPARNPQSWIIYDMKNGGLPDIPNSPDDPHAQFGVIPCSAVRHHAVAWWREGDGIRTTLLSGRAPGKSFDLDSDIGHESVHAAFSPVPLFSQTMEEQSRGVPFSEATLGALSYEERARLAYTLCEVGLAMLRGEPRPTPTGLINIEEWDDARAFLRIAHDLMPAFGFGHALEMISGRTTAIGIDGPAFFAIGISALRTMWHLVPRVNDCVPPKESWYRSLPA